MPFDLYLLHATHQSSMHWFYLTLCLEILVLTFIEYIHSVLIKAKQALQEQGSVSSNQLIFI
jgi:hypothetical protein